MPAGVAVCTPVYNGIAGNAGRNCCSIGDVALLMNWATAPSCDGSGSWQFGERGVYTGICGNGGGGGGTLTMGRPVGCWLPAGCCCTSIWRLLHCCSSASYRCCKSPCCCCTIMFPPTCVGVYCVVDCTGCIGNDVPLETTSGDETGWE